MENNFLNALAERLKELRMDRKLSIYSLSKKTGLSESSISRWENCGAEIKAGQLIILADFFGVTVDYLLGRED